MIVRRGAAGLPLRRALLLHSLSAHALNLHNRNPMQSHNMRSHKRDPTPQIIVAAPYPFSCLPISSQIRRLTVPYPFSCLPISFPIRRSTVILARLPHQVTLTVRYPSACFRLLGACFRRLAACFRLLDRGEAVRRESRGAAEVTDGGGRVVLLAVLLPAHELHDVTGKCLPPRRVGGGLPGQTDRDGARVDDLRVCDGVGHAADGVRSRLSQLGLLGRTDGP